MIREITIINKEGYKESIKLTDKQKYFCEYYVKTNRLSESYIKAGYKKHDHDSQNIQLANRMLVNKQIGAYIAHLRREIEKENDITLKEIINVLAEQMRLDIKSLYDETGKMKNIKDITSDVTRHIKKIKEVERVNKQGNKTINREIELYDKQIAIEKLIKIIGGYELDNRQKSVIDYSQLSDSVLLEIAQATEDSKKLTIDI